MDVQRERERGRWGAGVGRSTLPATQVALITHARPMPGDYDETRVRGGGNGRGGHGRQRSTSPCAPAAAAAPPTYATLGEDCASDANGGGGGGGGRGSGGVAKAPGQHASSGATSGGGGRAGVTTAERVAAHLTGVLYGVVSVCILLPVILGYSSVLVGGVLSLAPLLARVGALQFLANALVAVVYAVFDTLYRHDTRRWAPSRTPPSCSSTPVPACWLHHSATPSKLRPAQWHSRLRLSTRRDGSGASSGRWPRSVCACVCACACGCSWLRHLGAWPRSGAHGDHRHRHHRRRLCRAQLPAPRRAAGHLAYMYAYTDLGSHATVCMFGKVNYCFACMSDTHALHTRRRRTAQCTHSGTQHTHNSVTTHTHTHTHTHTYQRKISGTTAGATYTNPITTHNPTRLIR